MSQSEAVTSAHGVVSPKRLQINQDVRDVSMFQLPQIKIFEIDYDCCTSPKYGKVVS